MISVEEAYRIIMDDERIFRIRTVAIDDAIGRTIAEDIFADRDFPPFDRVAMDGIAIRYEDVASGINDFSIEGISRAGSPQTTLSTSGNCLEVMTGTMTPITADTVIRYEDISIVEDRASIQGEIKPYSNIHKKGSDIAAGDLLIPSGTVLKDIHVNICATVGRKTVEVIDRPQVAIVSTGNELIPVSESPLPHQIRRSNVYMMKSAIKEMGGDPVEIHIDDHRESLKQHLSHLMDNHDAVLLSGGVSKGKYDYIPEILEDLGCECLFHKVSQRPGKPFWFGRKGETSVFAFPGNPISTLMCFHRYFVPWYYSKMGQRHMKMKVELKETISFNSDLTFFPAVKIEMTPDGWVAIPIESNGSGDMVSPSQGDGFVELPRGKDIFDKGEIYDFIPFRRIVL